MLSKLKDFFFKKQKPKYTRENFPLKTDMHSHLLPGLDDGAKNNEEALELAKRLSELGYRKLICTPHVMGDFYKNTRSGILSKLDELRIFFEKNNLKLELEAAAEYYLDEWFEEKLKNKELLSFGDNYLLVETSYINKPANLHQLLFDVQTAGYKPVLAHPERYDYIKEGEYYHELKEAGILLQLNIASLVGHYSPRSKKMADYMIDHKLVDFVGTDTHHLRHIDLIQSAVNLESFEQLCKLDLLNNEL